MSRIEYIYCNRIVMVFGTLLFCLFMTLNYFGVTSCIHVVLSGSECGSCGITRDIWSFLKFDFNAPHNVNSLGVFVFGIIQLIFRLLISILFTEIGEGEQRFVYSQNVNIKKVIIADAMITFVLGVVVFLPFWV